MNNKKNHIESAHRIIISLGLPRAQQNERSALCLLALLNLAPDKIWVEAENPLIGITSGDTIRRESLDEGRMARCPSLGSRLTDQGVGATGWSPLRHIEGYGQGFQSRCPDTRPGKFQAHLVRDSRMPRMKR